MAGIIINYCQAIFYYESSLESLTGGTSMAGVVAFLTAPTCGLIYTKDPPTLYSNLSL